MVTAYKTFLLGGLKILRRLLDVKINKTVEDLLIEKLHCGTNMKSIFQRKKLIKWKALQWM
jgi:hypothetical protein